MIGNPIYGWVKLIDNKLYDWSTFTLSRPASTTGWAYVFKLPNQCDSNELCNQNLSSNTEVFFNNIFTGLGEGELNIHFYYDTIPVKFTVLKNGTEVFNSGFVGLPAYQSELDNFLAVYELPPETISPSPNTLYQDTIVNTDVIEVQVICMIPEKSSYYYRIDCIDTPDNNVDCVLSSWSVWSAWQDNGDGTETRTRTRTIVTQPEGNGEPCGALIEQETRDKTSVDCVLSSWSVWSAWQDNGDGTQSRTRTRTVLVPPSNGGRPCGDLVEVQTVVIPQDCVMSDWSPWSDWVKTSPGFEQRSRTRTVITQPTDGGQPCGDTVEVETRAARVKMTVIFEAEELDAEYRIRNAFVGDDTGNILQNQDFNVSSTPTTFTGLVHQDIINISFHQEILTPRDGLRTRITIKNALGVVISMDEAIDLSNYSKILTFSGQNEIFLRISIYN